MAIKVFAMNDCDWYAGETEDDVLREMADTLCFPTTPEGIEEMRAEHGVVAGDYPAELTEEDLRRLTFHDEDGEGENGRDISFRQRLDELIANGEPFPCMFASTEY